MRSQTPAVLPVAATLVYIMLWYSFSPSHVRWEYLTRRGERVCRRGDWPHYNGTQGGTHYSRLNEASPRHSSAILRTTNCCGPVNI